MPLGGGGRLWLVFLSVQAQEYRMFIVKSLVAVDWLLRDFAIDFLKVDGGLHALDWAGSEVC